MAGRELGWFEKTWSDLFKVPGVAETLDWAVALSGLGVETLGDNPEIVHETLLCLLKTREDRARMSAIGSPPGRRTARRSCSSPGPSTA